MIKNENHTHIRSYFDLMLYSVELLLEDEHFQLDADHEEEDEDDENDDGDDDESKNSTIRIMKPNLNQHYHQQQQQNYLRRKQIAREFAFEMYDHEKLPEKVIDEMRQVLHFEQLLANVSILK